MALIQHHENIKLFTSALISTIFNDLTISTDKEYKIPVFITTGDNRSNSRINKDVANQLPAIVISITSLVRNPDRQRNRFSRNKVTSVKTDDLKIMFSFADMSYDIHYTIDIIASNTSQLFMIMEHIYSFFHDGKYYMNIKLPLYDQQMYSCPIVIDSEDIDLSMPEDELTKSNTTRASLSVTVKAILHAFIDVLSYEKTHKNGKLKSGEKEFTKTQLKHIINDIVYKCDENERHILEKTSNIKLSKGSKID